MEENCFVFHLQCLKETDTLGRERCKAYELGYHAQEVATHVHFVVQVWPHKVKDMCHTVHVQRLGLFLLHECLEPIVLALCVCCAVKTLPMAHDDWQVETAEYVLEDGEECGFFRVCCVI